MVDEVLVDWLTLLLRCVGGERKPTALAVGGFSLVLEGFG